MRALSSGWRRVVVRGEDPEPPVATSTRAAHAPATAQPPSTTFIEPGCEVDGRLVLDTSIRIDGEFNGSIVSQETVTIGDDAAVQATIEGRTVEVHGAVVGDVTASRELVLRAGSRLHGNVSTPCFVIERGAFFNGETRMYRPELAARRSDPAAEASDPAAAASPAAPSPRP